MGIFKYSLICAIFFFYYSGKQGKIILYINKYYINIYLFLKISFLLNTIQLIENGAELLLFYIYIYIYIFFLFFFFILIIFIFIYIFCSFICHKMAAVY